MSVTIDCGMCPAEIAAGLVACPGCGRPVTDADRAVLQVRVEGSDFAAHERGRKVRAGAKWIGALAILFTIAGPIAFAMQSSTADKALANLERFDDADELAPIAGKTYTAGELRALVRREPLQALIVNLVLAGAMGILWAWGRRAPLPAIACALALYIVVQVVNALLDPTTIFQGIIVKFVALAALGKGFQAALAARAATARPAGLIVQATVRCNGCGIVNAVERFECATCGTLLPRAAPIVIEGGAAMHADAAPPLVAPGGARGVVRVFLAFVVLGSAGAIAAKAGAPELVVDVTLTVALVFIALGCMVAAGRELWPLLSSTGGVRGGVEALLGFGVLIAGGVVYFSSARGLGFPFVHPSDVYVMAGWPRWTAFAFGAVAPGILEEITFRGYLLARLDRLLTRNEALVVQAALFSMLHFGVIILPSHFGIGIVLGMLRRRSGSLYPGMAVHMSWNALIIANGFAGREFP